MYEYKLIPAPKRADRARGVKGAEARMAHTVETAINDLAREGWEYHRADVLPAEERQGLSGRSTVYHTLLVFRRPLERPETEAQFDLLPDVAEPDVTEPETEMAPAAPAEDPAPAESTPERPETPGNSAEPSVSGSPRLFASRD